jgi:hypothetical protein
MRTPEIEGFLHACIAWVFPTAEEQRQAQLAGAQQECAGRQVGVRELGALLLTGMLRLITAPAHWQLGLVAQPTILSLYYLTDGEAPLLTLPLHHALLPAVELAEEASFFKAVEQLSSPGKAAVVVTRDQQPIGILTRKDMTLAFRALCEGIILVERIELMLRDQIGRAYPAEEALNAAAVATFGLDPEHPHYALRNPHKLGLGGTIQLISDPDNWPCFEPILGPRVVFLRLMERVREIRNQLQPGTGEGRQDEDHQDLSLPR